MEGPPQATARGYPPPRVVGARDESTSCRRIPLRAGRPFTEKEDADEDRCGEQAVGGHLGNPGQHEGATGQGEEKVRGKAKNMAEVATGDAELEEVVRRIGLVELKRTEEEVQRVVEKLATNWVTCLNQWRALSAERKRELRLPLMLLHRLDEEAAAAGARQPQQPSPKRATFATHQEGEEEEEQVEHQENDHVARVDRTVTSIKCTVKNKVYEFDKDEPLSSLLKQLGAGQSCPCHLFRRDETQVPRRCKLSLALVPGSRLVIGDCTFIVKPAYRENAIDKWLQKLSLERYANTFAHFGIDDFFALPFLSDHSLQHMGIGGDQEATSILLKAINQIIQTDAYSFVGMWLDCLGIGHHAAKFTEELVTLDSLRFLEEADCRDMGITDNTELRIIMSEIDRYKRFSSVEETFTWLRSNGFEKYSFHFSRYNIPFYALPFVNFFIIDEMGVTHDDQILLQALQSLKTSPNYCTKAMTYWLRDLEMEHYNLTFAKRGLTDLEDLILLLDQDVESLIGEGAESTKMKDALKEMKEFQYYYSATASLLQELGIERYAQLFALHGISVDMLSVLRDDQLIDMGITDPSDRRKILTAVQKIKENLPSGMATWLKEYDKGLIDDQQQLRPTNYPPMKTNVGARSERRSSKKGRDQRGKKRTTAQPTGSKSRPSS